MISGTLLNDAGMFTDKAGKNYVRFTVTCGTSDVFGRTIYSHYRCICYFGGYDKMKKGDQVFLTGRFTPSVILDDKGKPQMNLDVMVTQITRGYEAKDKVGKQK